MCVCVSIYVCVCAGDYVRVRVIGCESVHVECVYTFLCEIIRVYVGK